jgi:hypothetical protein
MMRVTIIPLSYFAEPAQWVNFPRAPSDYAPLSHEPTLKRLSMPASAAQSDIRQSPIANPISFPIGPSQSLAMIPQFQRGGNLSEHFFNLPPVLPAMVNCSWH